MLNLNSFSFIYYLISFLFILLLELEKESSLPMVADGLLIEAPSLEHIPVKPQRNVVLTAACAQLA
jgi:hypothetical protein